MINGYLFLNDKKIKSLYYHGLIYSFKLTTKKDYRLFGKFKIDNKANIFAKNIPSKYILLTDKYLIIDYIIPCRTKQTHIYLYLYNNQDLIRPNINQKVLINSINNQMITHYKKMFNTKIKSTDRILENYFNNLLPKKILNESVDFSNSVIAKYKSLPFTELLKIYNSEKISSIDFYLILKQFIIGINESSEILRVKPNIDSINYIIIDNIKINIENRNIKIPYMFIDNTKFYNLWSIEKKCKYLNLPITLVI